AKISAVYRSVDSYLRIGSPDKIHRDLVLHKNMEKAGFPVARLIEEGEENGEAYFIESSLGDKHFGVLFAEDVARTGSIREETFQQFISICELFARAQLSTRSETKGYAEFAKGIWLGQLCEEMPENAEAIITRFEKLRKHTEQLPFVLTHGDFNPNNLYPGGVIDLEDAFPGPYGYDLVSAISHIESFPTSEGYEYLAKYHFTEAQIQEFSERLNVISKEAGLVPLSEFWNDFEFCRAVWLAADIPNTPKLQQFRYTFVIENS
ncbi:MAG: aminoglycoside phosphotransferase family protein, partial [Candidatus Paceibacterota bacterium]